MYRSEALRGAALLSSSFSPPTITGKFSLFFFPEETVVTSIIDSAGNNVTTTYLKGTTTVPANTTIVVNGDGDGDYFSAITISSGSVNYVNA